MNRFRLLSAVALSLLLQACGTMQFNPAEYPLRAGLIASGELAGPVQVTNAQSATDPVIVYSYGGSKLQTSLNAITAVMAKQTEGEIAKNFKSQGGANAKRLEIKVDHLLSEYLIMSWKSEIRFTVKLGNGVEIKKSAKHASGSLHQDLNGCVAEGVMHLLNDPQVRAYLSQP